ncbi:concanavalin A-like lectin/glucanase domain-containing protein [Fimicolochytrium jonesii]|uniref:concanavalin A-like lectin/glucanase domain-containing protein n=1 Tax=Fimicolochytrium jonesii TaxID=1396493 RepID=UPI0022FF1AEB|nr:concanavalin A-like lectin/glucanase domain-containing protein [Fimicolochytrium jonesii]KAI8815562.1 concanavalin A-like lectin/glucanase domain-containing protein [Fimicolochytrium jonesii]
MHFQTLFLAALAAVPALFVSAYIEPNYELHSEGLVRRHDYRQALKQPYFMYDEVKVPYFKESGSTILSHDYIRLTPSVPESHGSIWAVKPNPHPEWQVEFSFHIYGRGYMGGEGMAFWYTKQPMDIGPFYGGKDKFEGLGIIFDTADQHESRYTPYIYAVLNNGHEDLLQQRNYAQHALAGCFRDYRNTPAAVWARVTYANQTVRVDLDLTQHGQSYHECFTTPASVKLPPNYYFGLSAQTEAHLADDHDLLTFEVYELNPKPIKEHPKRPYEKEHIKKEGEYRLDADMKKMIEKVEKDVETARHEQEAAQDPNAQFQTLDPHAVQRIEGNQFHIIEALNQIQTKLGEPLTPHSQQPVAHEEQKEHNQQQRAATHDLAWKVDDLGIKLDELMKEVKLLGVAYSHTQNKVEEVHQNVKQQASQGHQVQQQQPPSSQQQQQQTGQSYLAAAPPKHHLSIVGALGFAAGLILMWIVSLIKRAGTKVEKKFI